MLLEHVFKLPHMLGRLGTKPVLLLTSLVLLLALLVWWRVVHLESYL